MVQQIRALTALTEVLSNTHVLAHNLILVPGGPMFSSWLTCPADTHIVHIHMCKHSYTE